LTSSSIYVTIFFTCVSALLSKFIFADDSSC